MAKTCSRCLGPLPRGRKLRYCRACKAAYNRNWRQRQPTRRQVSEALQPHGLALVTSPAGVEIVKRETFRHGPRK